MLDLDRFQMLNDSLGHQFGDELLVRVAERLNQLSDERILVAYSGGDEFMFCQQQMENIDDVIHLLGHIRHCFETPFEVQGEGHRITATMGVAIYPHSGQDADTLLRNADVALYRAKEQGRNSYQFYTEGMQEREVTRLELDDEHLVDDIRKTLETEHVTANHLEVELTEEIFIQNIEHNRNQLGRLHELGVNLVSRLVNSLTYCELTRRDT